MSLPKLMLIINPISGVKSKRGLAERLEARLHDMGYEVDTVLTTCRGDATRLANLAVKSGSYYGVLACGGDGTVNETANALCGTGLPLGIIPAGSGNGLARHIGIPIDPMLSLDVIQENHIVDCDYASVDSLNFFCTFGMGFDAAVSDRFASKKKRGKLTYIKSAIEEFRSYRAQDYNISIDGAEPVNHKAFIVAVCNASQYGNNAFIAPTASITDGLLDVIIVHETSKWRKFILALDLMMGRLNKNKNIQTYHAHTVEISRAKPGSAHLDGEPIKLGTHIAAHCHPAQLRVFATAKKGRFHPFISPVKMMLKDIGIKIRNLFHR